MRIERRFSLLRGLTNVSLSPYFVYPFGAAGIVVEAIGVALSTWVVFKEANALIADLSEAKAEIKEFRRIAGSFRGSSIEVRDDPNGGVFLNDFNGTVSIARPPDPDALGEAHRMREILWVGAGFVVVGILMEIAGTLMQLAM